MPSSTAQPCWLQVMLLQSSSVSAVCHGYNQLPPCQIVCRRRMWNLCEVMRFKSLRTRAWWYHSNPDKMLLWFESAAGTRSAKISSNPSFLIDLVQEWEMLGTSAEEPGEPGHQQESREAEEASAQAGCVLDCAGLCCVAEIDCRPPVDHVS